MTVAIGAINPHYQLLEAFRSILGFYFGSVALSTIEKLSPSSLDHFSPADIVVIAKELKLNQRHEAYEPKNIQLHLLPCIAIDSQQKAVMISAFEGEFVRMVARFGENETLITRAEFEKRFSRFIFFSKPDLAPKSLDIGDHMSKAWFYAPIKKAWRSYVEIGFLTLFINIFGLALPLFTMNVYNRVVPNFATETLFVLSFGVAAVFLFDVLLKSARVYILEGVTKKISNELEEELFKKTLSIQSAHDRFLVGTKTNLFRELSVVKDFFATKVLHFLDLPFFFTAVLVIYIINPTLAIIPVAAAALTLLLNFSVQYPLATLHKKSFEGAQSKHGYLVEQLYGHEAIKLSNGLAKRLFKWRQIVNFYNHIQGKVQLLSAVTSFVSQALLQGVSLVTVIVGVYCIQEGSLSVGGLIAVTLLAGRAMAPVIGLSGVLSRYKQTKEALQSLNVYWHLPTESQKPSELGIGKASGAVTFEDVTFSYPNAKYPSVQNVSFTIRPGEKVGIIGQTGAGKSTIQKLLTGIEMPSSGRIFLDDKDTSIIHPVELRENIALMPQEPYLFSGTLKENLELSRTISKAQMSDLLEQTGLVELVKKNGALDTLDVGERGSKLSVGQRHLVALGRALLSDAPVLILDEPTTGLDVGLERKLVHHLENSLKEKTVIVITHRFAALDLVDRVILIHEGKVAADGKKEQVLAMLQGKKG